MCRLGPRLCTLCSAASLLLCAAACAQWVRSYSHEDRIPLPFLGPGRAVRSTAGSLRVGNEHLWLDWRAESRAASERFARSAVEKRDLVRRDHQIRRARSAVGGRRDAEVDAELDLLNELERDLRARADALRRDILPPPPPGEPSFVRVVPYWLPVLCLAAPPAASMLRWARRARRRQRGLCRQCGYDLRATPRRCPECGMDP
jgi:hypothetical protein